MSDTQKTETDNYERNLKQVQAQIGRPLTEHQKLLFEIGYRRGYHDAMEKL
jgi:hypothetical protein